MGRRGVWVAMAKTLFFAFSEPITLLPSATFYRVEIFFSRHVKASQSYSSFKKYRDFRNN